MQIYAEFVDAKNGLIWKQTHPRATLEMLGYIPGFLSVDDPRPTREQFAERYISEWSPFPGFTMLASGNLSYPEDPETRLLFECQFRGELIRVYEHAWVAVVQKDGAFEISRMD